MTTGRTTTWQIAQEETPWTPLVPSGPTATFQWCDQAQLVLPCCGGTDSPPKQLALVRLTMIAKNLHWLHKSTGEVHRYSSKFNRSAGPQTCLGKYVQKTQVMLLSCKWICQLSVPLHQPVSSFLTVLYIAGMYWVTLVPSPSDATKRYVGQTQTS